MSFKDLPRNTNQALGIAEYAIEFMKSGTPSAAVLDRPRSFMPMRACVACQLWHEHQRPQGSRQEALSYPAGGGRRFWGCHFGFARESHLGELLGRS